MTDHIDGIIAGMSEAERLPIAHAHYNTPYRLMLEDGSEITGRLIPGGSLNEDESPCDQWVADGDDYPPCWSGGCCWESNEDGEASLQPVSYREKANG